MPNKSQTSIDKELRIKYNIDKFDKKPTLGNPGESWDMFIIRKMREERLYNEARKNLGLD